MPEDENRIASPVGASEFQRFAEVCERIGGESGKLKKTQLLAAYLRSLDEAQLPIAAVYFTGRPFAQSDPRKMQVGWAVVQRALRSVSGMTDAQLHRVGMRHGDAGDFAFEVLRDRTQPQPWALVDSRLFLDALEQQRGPRLKSELLTQTLSRLSPLEGKYLIKILSGDLRIGLKEGLLEAAIAVAFGAPLDDVQTANMLTGDIGRTALLASRGELVRAGITLFRPVKCMLATPEPTAQSVWSRAGIAGRVWMEDKFDGIRAQLHRGAGRVEIFSRDLRPVTAQFEEIVMSAARLGHEVILDGEIIASDPERKLTFFDLQKRLGRTGGDLFLQSEIPVAYMAFDLLWCDGESLLRVPLRERRRKLADLDFPGLLKLVDVTWASSPQEIESGFAAARGRSNEGLVIKAPESLYTPGRRGLAWLKLKKELATLDVVVVGAELGHGKRARVLSDYTFAVRDDASGELRTIGKAYSGLTDAEIAELTTHFKARTISEHGKYRVVEPDVVLEVAFDSIQPSNRHTSGLALRFPRIKAIRRDKTVHEIDTLASAWSLMSGSPAASKR